MGLSCFLSTTEDEAVEEVGDEVDESDDEPLSSIIMLDSAGAPILLPAAVTNRLSSLLEAASGADMRPLVAGVEWLVGDSELYSSWALLSICRMSMLLPLLELVCGGEGLFDAPFSSDSGVISSSGLFSWFCRDFSRLSRRSRASSLNLLLGSSIRILSVITMLIIDIS